MSKRTTVTLEDRHLEQLEAVKAEMDEDEPSNSAAIRRVFDDAAECDEHRNRIESLVNRRDELRKQLAAANERIDASNELVRAVEASRSLEARRAQAGALTRLKWWATGMPDDEDPATS
jgi:uncharacterized protein involved in exopolysaccharide biosynthesis